MRKIAICVLLALLTALMLPALAEEAGASLSDLDLSGASLEELKELRDRVTQMIQEMESTREDIYGSGTYAVGIDIPVGVYLVTEDDHSIFPSITLRKGASSDSQLIAYEMIIHQAVVQLSAGSYLTLSDCTAYPFDQAPENGLVDGEGGEGGYWIGVQIPAGRYRIVPEETAPLSSYSIYSGVLGTGAQTLSFELIYGDTELDLVTGQYIVLSGCGIRVIE